MFNLGIKSQIDVDANISESFFIQNQFWLFIIELNVEGFIL